MKTIFNKKQNLLALRIIPVAAFGIYLYTQFKKSKIQSHPTYEAVEMALKLDPRITKFCGKNYKISPGTYYDEDSKRCTYRIKVSGIRGDCNVLIKCEKDTHGFLSNIMKDQINYSKSNKEDKKKDPFTAINFSDILIPSEETMKKIENAFINNKDYLIFNKEDYLNGKYYDKALSTPQMKINYKDTFYRITSISMVANDSLVFNVRPIGPKYRNYNIEDTYYNNHTYIDVILNLHNMRFKYNEIISSEISTQELKEDLIQQKHTNFEKRIKQRKYVLLFNGIIILTGIFVIKTLMSHNIDVTAVSTISNSLVNNMKLKNIYGSNRLIAVSYKFNPFKWDYNISGLIMGTQKNGKLDGKVEISDKTVYKNLKFYTIDDENNKINLI